MFLYCILLLVFHLNLDAVDAVACPTKAADIVFILDSSCSVNQNDNTNYDRFKEFMQNITKSLSVGIDMVHIGVVRYSQISEKMFGLDAYYTQNEVVTAIDDITYQCSSTNTHLGLKMAREDFFTGSNGDRPELPNIAIVLTDGKSTNPTETVAESTLAHNASIYVIAVGVEGADQTELNAIGSDPDSDYVAYVANFPDIGSVEDKITERCCQAAQVPIFCITEECFAASGQRSSSAWFRSNVCVIILLIVLSTFAL